MVEVAAALFRNNGRFMICRRPAAKARGLLWEFVGGKAEPGESLPQALVRECFEELDISVTVGDVFASVVHDYPDITVKLTVFNASFTGTPKLLEHSDIKWILPSEISQYDFCPADENILQKIVCEDIRARLFALKDDAYAAFQCRLMPGISPDRVIGVRTPALRALAKELAPSPLFTAVMPHEYYDENNLHAFIIARIGSFDDCVRAVDAFLPFVDNWATCDQLRPACFKRHLPLLYDKIKLWISSDRVFTVRFGIEMLMTFFLDSAYTVDCPELAASVHSDEYYINMMLAWFFATALAKQYDTIIPYIENRRLDPWVHNKTIQKAVESFRITDEQKAYLRSLKLSLS